MYLLKVCYKVKITTVLVCKILSAHPSRVSLLWKSGIVIVSPSQNIKLHKDNPTICHDPFPELSPTWVPPPCCTQVYSNPTLPCSTGCPNQSWPCMTMPHGPPLLYPRLWPEPWSECTPMAQGIWAPSKVTWPSHDDYTTMCHPGHLISRPPSQQSWDLRVPTLIPFDLFLSYYMLMLL